MGVQIISGASSDVLTVDPTSKAARTTLYDTAGNLISPLNQAALALTSGGVINAARDYKLARTLRASSIGTLRTSDDAVFLYDSVEGAAYDSNKWVQTLSSFTVTQATGVLTMNAGSSITINQGAVHVSHKWFPFFARFGLVFRTKVRVTANFNGCQVDMGFGSPASAIAANVTNGAHWRKDATGQILPVICIAGNEFLGTAISDATFRATVAATDYAIFEVYLEDSRATFSILTQTGVLVNQQTVEWPVATAGFSQTHVQAFHRIWNSGSPGTAVQLLVSGTSVIGVDSAAQRSWDSALSGMNYNSLTNPVTTYAQLATWTNSGTPAGFTLTNTTAPSTGLGGLVNANAMATGLTTDLILVAYTVPVGYTFFFTGITISPPINLVVIVATTATHFNFFGMAFNSSAISLATAGTYPPMRIPIPGTFQMPVAGIVGGAFTGNPITWQPKTPIAVHSGRLLHVLCRCTLGTATATETYLFPIGIEGWFE